MALRRPMIIHAPAPARKPASSIPKQPAPASAPGLFAASRSQHTKIPYTKPVAPQPAPVVLRTPTVTSHHQRLIHPPVRFFATDKKVLEYFKKSEAHRVSVAEPRAQELIVAVRNEDYAKAIRLVRTEGVNVDGHTSGENTALADAAKRGDTKGVRFLLKDLKANPDASCDCPAHRTALHYAAQGGHADTVKVLLEHGAKLNALDSRGKNALHVAKGEQVIAILQSHQESERKKLLELGGMPERKYLPK